ncbi:MAG: HEAT repeat domain-containing protein [Elusimicrobia bacterium]|nr:HEAT repeat domain-containing protein [Elusimicrobiota bacterium]
MARVFWGILACAFLRPLAAAQAPDQEGVSVWASVASTDGAHLAALSADLKLGLWNERIHAVHELEPYGAAGRPLLEYAARDADWQVRLTAVHFLGRLGRPALPALAEILKEEPCRHVRITAIHWLGSMGVAASGVLAEALGDESGMARLTGRYWLRKLGQEDTSASAEGLDSQTAKTEELKACRPSLQPGRLGLVQRLAAQTPAAPRAEIAELELPSAAPAASSATARPAPEAFPSPAAPGRPSAQERNTELDKLLADTEPAMGPAPGIPESLPPGPPGAGPRDNAEPAIALAGTSPRSGPGPATVAAPNDPERLPPGAPGAGLRPAPPAETALAEDHGRPKPENDPLPELIKTLRKGDARARARAADEAGKRGAKAAAALPALLSNLKHSDRRVRASAALALGNIGAAADSAVPALVRLLKDPSEDVQSSAAVALGRLGTPRARRAFRRYLRDQAGSLARPAGVAP